MKPYLKLFALLLLSLTFIGSCFAVDENLKAATSAAEQWLALVDAGKYPESWDAASQAFKDAVTKKDWVDSVKGARDPAGEVTSRRLTKADLMKNPPNAPPGDYVGMTYQSSFAKLGAAAETVVMLLDKDGKWRLDGYYVQKAQ